MSDAVAGIERAAPVAPSRSATLGLALLSFALWVALFLIVSGVHNFNETQKELRLLPYLPYDERVDFAYFYAAADMVRNGDAAQLYPKHLEYTFYPRDPLFGHIDDPYVDARIMARGNYYNPPALAFLEAPLSALSFRSAFWTFSVIGGLALFGFVGLTWRAGAALPEIPLHAAGTLDFRPVHEAVMMGHPSLVFVFALGAGFLALRGGRPVLAGVLLSVLAFKPQWAVIPAALLLARGEWRALTAMAVASAIIVFVPFLATGPDTFKDYLRFLKDSATVDIKVAPHMFSWNGFLSKRIIFQDPIFGALASPNLMLLYSLCAFSIALMLVVWRGRDFYLSVAAAVVCMLLVSTRSVWYDWAFLVVPAAFLVLRPSTPAVRVQSWVLLLALFAASAQSVSVLFAPDGRYGDIHWTTQGFFSVTLVAFGSLVWMAGITIVEGRFKLPWVSWRRRMAT
jgi:alpha-1,2-mannosyltransferase